MRICYFYGISIDEVLNMDADKLYLYIDALPSLIAESNLWSIQSTTYPHLKKNAQDKVYRRLSRLINKYKSKALMSVEEFFHG